MCWYWTMMNMCTWTCKWVYQMRRGFPLFHAWLLLCYQIWNTHNLSSIGSPLKFFSGWLMYGEFQNWLQKIRPQKYLPMTWCLAQNNSWNVEQKKRKILSIFVKFLGKIELLSHQITLRNAKQKVDFVYLLMENWSKWECQTSFSEISKYLTKQLQTWVIGRVLYHHIYFTIVCCVLLIWWPTLIGTIIFYHIPSFTSM